MTDRAEAQASADGRGEPVPRNWLRLLLDPMFGRFVLGRLISSAGIWIYNVVAALLAYELTGSAFVVGLVSVAQFLPQILLAPWSGVLADRGNRKHQVIIGRLIVAGGSGALALWLELGRFTDEADAVALLVSAVVVGLGFVTGGPAMHAIVPSLVRRREIAAAVTLNMAPATLARAAGPSIGVAIAFGMGSPFALGVAAACSLGFAIALVSLREPPPRRLERGDRSVRAGLAFLRTDPVARALLVGIATIGFGADPAMTLAPSVSSNLGHGSSYTGAFASAFGVGSGVAFLLIPATQRWVSVPARGAGGFLLMAGGLVVLVAARSPGVAACGFMVAGLGMALGVTSLSAQLQLRVPDNFRGRVMAYWSLAFLGSRPIAAGVNGAIADLVSVAAALLLATTVLVGGAYLCGPRRLGRKDLRGAAGPG